MNFRNWYPFSQLECEKHIFCRNYWTYAIFALKPTTEVGSGKAPTKKSNELYLRPSQGPKKAKDHRAPRINVPHLPLCSANINFCSKFRTASPKQLIFFIHIWMKKLDERLNFTAAPRLQWAMLGGNIV